MRRPPQSREVLEGRESGLWASFPGIVLTSTMTSIGLVLFCAYDLVIALRDTS